MKEVAAIFGLVLLVVILLAAVGVVFFTAAGLAIGAFIWGIHALAGPFSGEIPDSAIPWICACIVGCALAAAVGKRRAVKP